ncbi:hypothetical protein [Micromonospora sp. NPDC047730]|uniref:hypothetical protein n=1 Tax=Micromonospora sp. NPDC047730 TaxID=3364253 RepID=UPI003713F66B
MTAWSISSAALSGRVSDFDGEVGGDKCFCFVPCLEAFRGVAGLSLCDPQFRHVSGTRERNNGPLRVRECFAYSFNGLGLAEMHYRDAVVELPAQAVGVDDVDGSVPLVLPHHVTGGA